GLLGASAWLARPVPAAVMGEKEALRAAPRQEPGDQVGVPRDRLPADRVVLDPGAAVPEGEMGLPVLDGVGVDDGEPSEADALLLQNIQGLVRGARVGGVTG